MTLRVAGRAIASPLVLSPMVDVTDAAFRSLAHDWGADITCSEMVSSRALLADNPHSWDLVRPWPGECPYGVQIMGAEPEHMADAVRAVAARHPVDFIDLNLGCPSPKVLRSCAGAFLLRDSTKAGQVIAAAVEAGKEAGVRTVTAKLRMGHDHDHLTYLEVGAEAQAAGAGWVTLHGRTVAQGYSGEADWSSIARLVDHLDIPVVGNGDIRTPEDVVRMRDETGCAGFFIARAAMRDPTIFARMRQALDGEPVDQAPDLPMRAAALRTYMHRAKQIGIHHLDDLRRQAMRFIAGAPGAKEIRKQLHDASDADAIMACVEDRVHQAGGALPRPATLK